MLKRILLRRLGMVEIERVVRYGALAECGWPRSIRDGMSVDAQGNPIPWISYPCIDFLGPRVPRSASVFEFGCGNSTLWWASRTTKVRAVEHDRPWFDRISRTMPENVILEYRDLETGGAYSRACRDCGETFEIVVVDGRDRVNCIRNSLDRLSEDGILILDNSERAEYAEGLEAARTAGFRRIDFWGMAPLVDYRSCTSVLYRDRNCLGI